MRPPYPRNNPLPGFLRPRPLPPHPSRRTAHSTPVFLPPNRGACQPHSGVPGARGKWGAETAPKGPEREEKPERLLGGGPSGQVGEGWNLGGGGSLRGRGEPGWGSLLEVEGLELQSSHCPRNTTTGCLPQSCGLRGPEQRGSGGSLLLVLSLATCWGPLAPSRLCTDQCHLLFPLCAHLRNGRTAPDTPSHPQPPSTPPPPPLDPGAGRGVREGNPKMFPNSASLPGALLASHDCVIPHPHPAPAPNSHCPPAPQSLDGTDAP